MIRTHRLPPPIADLWEWQLRAACRNLPPESFFHPDQERDPRRQRRIDAAKQVGAHCPVHIDCRDHALSAREPYGIWGGLSEDERQNAWAYGA